MRREVFGYATAGSLGDSTIGYPSWNFDDLSTVAFFAIHVQYDGQLVGDSDFAVWDSSTFSNFLSTAHAHGTKVVVTITGPTDSPVDMCDALYNDQTTISQLMNQVKAKGVDGVNIDYEGEIGQCQNVVDPSLNTTNQALITKLAKDMRAALDAIKPGYYLSIATYSGSASANDGFFNIPNLNQYVDAFFVMAYDMDEANQPYPPLNCSSFCMNPISPLANYYWNDTTSMTQYTGLVGAGKVILGQPYYGRVACVASPVEHARSTGYFSAVTYTGAASVASSADVQPGTYSIHRDSVDANGLDRWDTWYDNALGCWREMYWDDTTTLINRYQLVNQMGLRGVGFWTLNYGAGSAELWTALQTYFKGCYSVSLKATPASPSIAGTAITLTATAGCPDPSPQLEYWILMPGASGYQVLAPYSTSNTFTWQTGGLFPGTYRLAVWARDAGSSGEFSNPLGTFDTSNADTVYTVTTQPCSAVSLTASPPPPAAAGTSVILSAHASSSCPNPLYQYWVMGPGAAGYSVIQAYASGASFTFDTTGKTPGAYSFAVWARDTSSPGTFGNSLGRFDASNSVAYLVTTCVSASIGAAPTSAAAVGAAVTMTAHSSGCANPQYQFWTLAPGASSWTIVQPYSAGNTFSWATAGKVPGSYQLAVWVRDAASGGAYTNSLGSFDLSTAIPYTITSCTSAGLGASPSSTAAVGAPVTVTATASGCPNAGPQFQFWVLAPGAGWAIAQPYSSSNTFSWSTAGKTPGVYQLAVWVRDASSAGAGGNSLGTWDVVSFGSYTVTTCTGASLSSSTSGTTVTFAATATGCPNPGPQYQFWVLAPGASSWTMVQPYSASNTFNWSTSGKAKGAYQIAVWVRDASSAGAYSNSLGTWDVGASQQYTLS